MIIYENILKRLDGKEKKVWDLTTFNPAFFRVLERQITQLDALGIQVDLSGLDRLVTEPQRNDSLLISLLQQIHRRRVAQHMRADPLLL